MISPPTNFYLFGVHQTSQSNLYNYLLYLISNHFQFKNRVNICLTFLPSPLTTQPIIKLGTLIYTLLFPDFPQKYHRKMANQLLQSLQIQIPGENNNNVTVTYTNLVEYLLKICSDSVENVDLRSCLAFLDLIISRVTDLYIVDVKDEKFKEKVQYTMKLILYDPEQVIIDVAIPEQRHNDQSKKLYYSQSLTEILPQTLPTTRCYKRQLKKSLDSVIPLGYVCQQLIHHLINHSFELSSSYRLQACKKVSMNDQKVDYYVEIPIMDTIRDKIVNQQIFQSCFLLSNDSLQNIVGPGQDYPSYRLNATLYKPNFYQKLRQLKSGEHKYYNILSQYYDRNQFNVDQLQLTREKLIVRRKEHLLGITGRETIKKQEKDYDDQYRIVGLRISKELVANLDQDRLQASIKALTMAMRSVLDQDRNINVLLEKNLSKIDRLPKDSNDPFTQDIITYAKMIPLQILILGRAKSGKSTLGRAIAKKYNLVFISIQSIIERLFQRLKFFEQNPPETDQQGNPIDGLGFLEKVVLEDLNTGRQVDPEDLLELMNNQMKSDGVINKGFILDLPLQYHSFWENCIISHRLAMPKISTRYFTHVIQTQQTEEQWKHFSEGVMEKPEELTLTSRLDRYLITKPKPLPEDPQQQPAEQDTEKPIPLIQNTLIKKHWKQSSPAIIDHLTSHLHPNNFIKLYNSYQSTDQCLKLLESRLYIIPLAKKIEGGEKELLSVGLEEMKIFRKWSPWGLVDSVQLLKEKLVMGKFQFAAEFAGRVFVFENQTNLNAFLAMPRKYLQKIPQLPKRTNICVVGPRKSGKKTIAEILAKTYKFRILNIQQIFEKVLIRQKSFESTIPSNPEKRSTSVHLSEGEFKEFSKGSSINAKDILPMVLFEIGVALQKKPLGWGVEKTEEEGQTKQENVEQKKPAPKKAKKKDNKVQDQRPKTPPLQDLTLREIIPELNHIGKLDQLKDFVIVGYPNNQQQLTALRSFNIPIDKMIILSDNAEQTPNKILSQRLNDAQIQQVSLFTTAIGPVKQTLTEQVYREFQIDKTPQQIVNKIRQFIDPFYLKCDDDTINRVISDKGEDGDPIPMGFCGDYCPVVMKEGWLFKGKEEFEAGVQGKRFRFSGENQLNAFKEDVQKYISIKDQKKVVPPRFMFMGIRGVGLKTQLIKFNEKYKIPILSLKDSLLQQVQNEKQKRKTERYYNKGFKIPEFDQQGKPIQDAELNQQSPDFDKRANQIQTTRNLFSGIEQIFINGNFFDIDQQKVSTSIVQLLSEARRLPQVVLMLNCDESKWLERVMDKSVIQKELELIKDRRRQEKEKERNEARKKAEENGEEYQEPTEEEQDPEVPKLQDMIAQKQETLKAQRQADSAKLQELAQAFKALNIEVINIKCERGPKYVTDKINHVLRPYLQDRHTTNWEKNTMLPIQRHRVPDFINNFIAKESRFGKLNPFTLMKPVYPYPLLYNDRIYYLQDEEERESVMRNHKLLDTNLSVPLDIKVVPTIYIIGKCKTGRTTLSTTLSKRLGFIKIDLRQITNQFTKDHHDHDINLLMIDLRNGKTLTDQNIVMLIEKRVSIEDCQSKGWILDGFPNNVKQCQLLNKKGLAPFNVFSIQLTDFEIKKRVITANSGLDVYDQDLDVVQKRLERNQKNLLQVESYYINRYNNFRRLDGHLSKWGLFQATVGEIQKTIKARRQFVRALTTHTPASASRIGLSYNCIINNLSEYSIFCPASYKIRREYIRKCPRHHQYLSIFNKKIYLLNSQKELQDFLQNPDTYINKGKQFSPALPVPITSIAKFTSKIQQKSYCIVELSRNKLVKGNNTYTLNYRNKYYCLSTPHNMKLFIKNPTLYEMATLQDKLPVEFEKKSQLKKIAKKNDCTAFLEHHLSNIMMRCLAQLGYRRPKYPTLGSKQSALKFLAIALKANNLNKDEEYRQKYSQQLRKFIKQSTYSQEIREELDRKEKEGEAWQIYDEQNLLKLCEEYNEFLGEMQKTDKVKYFSQFIR